MDGWMCVCMTILLSQIKIPEMGGEWVLGEQALAVECVCIHLFIVSILTTILSIHLLWVSFPSGTFAQVNHSRLSNAKCCAPLKPGMWPDTQARAQAKWDGGSELQYLVLKPHVLKQI